MIKISTLEDYFKNLQGAQDFPNEKWIDSELKTTLAVTASLGLMPGSFYWDFSCKSKFPQKSFYSFKEHFFDLVNSSLKPAISPYFSHLIIFPEKMYKSSLDEFVSNVIQIIVLNDRFSENNEILFFDPIVENRGFEMYVIENNINRLIPFGLKRKTVEVFLS